MRWAGLVGSDSLTNMPSPSSADRLYTDSTPVFSLIIHPDSHTMSPIMSVGNDKHTIFFTPLRSEPGKQPQSLPQGGTPVTTQPPAPQLRLESVQGGSARRTEWIGLVILLAFAMLAACDEGELPAPTELPTNTPSEAIVPTPPPSNTPTATPVPTVLPGPTAASSEPPDTPVVSIQFIGGADLSDEGKSSLAKLIERIQAGVVLIAKGGGSGSGFVISADGLVVTNEHVVDGERSVDVWLTNGRRYDGDVLERDTTSDLALVRIDSNDRFHAIAVGNPDSVRVGDEVLALGFPIADEIGTNLTVTRGIISSTRTVDGVDLLQTDAAINPGSSGGRSSGLQCAPSRR